MKQTNIALTKLIIAMCVLMCWAFPGCISGDRFLWENSRIETEMIVVEATPAKFVKILITNLNILEFTLIVSNKTGKQLYFYPLRLKVSGFEQSERLIYISDIIGYGTNVQYPLQPKSNRTIKVYISAETIDFQLEPHLKLQIAVSPIAEVAR